MVISFKSVGRTQQVEDSETPDQTTLPIGIKTPLQQGNSGEGIFAMHFDLRDQVRDNLRNLILTNWGERLGLWDFGGNLRELATEFVSRSDFDDQAVVRIKNAVSRWMPYVSLNDFGPTVEHEQNIKTGIISFRITYDVPILNVVNDALEISLFVI